MNKKIIMYFTYFLFRPFFNYLMLLNAISVCEQQIYLALASMLNASTTTTTYTTTTNLSPINTHIMQLQQNKKKINKINKQNGMLTLITIPQQ